MRGEFNCWEVCEFEMPVSRLLARKQFEKTNCGSVARFINSSTNGVARRYCEKILTAGNKCCFLIRITCTAHRLNRVVEKVCFFC